MASSSAECPICTRDIDEGRELECAYCGRVTCEPCMHSADDEAGDNICARCVAANSPVAVADRRGDEDYHAKVDEGRSR